MPNCYSRHRELLLRGDLPFYPLISQNLQDKLQTATPLALLWVALSTESGLAVTNLSVIASSFAWRSAFQILKKQKITADCHAPCTSVGGTLDRIGARSDEFVRHRELFCVAICLFIL